MFRVGASGTTDDTDDNTGSFDTHNNVSAKSGIVSGITNPGYTAASPGSNGNASGVSAVDRVMNGAAASDTIIDGSKLLGTYDLVVSLNPNYW